MVRHGDGLPRVSVARHIMLYECNVYGKAHFPLIIFVTVTVTVYSIGPKFILKPYILGPFFKFKSFS